MPPRNPSHQNQNNYNNGGEIMIKPNHKIVSIFLKSLVMTLITSLFLIFISIAAIFLLFLAAPSLLPRRRRRPRASPSRAAVRALAQFRFPAAGTAEPDIDCAVCLDALRPGQWCRALGACGHAFHRRCVDAWLVRVPKCPVCRARVRFDSCCWEEEEDEAKWWWGSSRVW